jgi:toxin ParE1/3/4
MRHRVAKTARGDLDAIYDYWAERADPEIAERLIYSITERFSLIAQSPDIGCACDEILDGIRVFPAGKYLIYHRKRRGVVHILHVLHGARDQANAFTQN